MSSEFERLVGRAVNDKAFRDRLLKDPEQTAKDEGFNLSDAELQQLKNGISKINQRMSPGEIDNIFGTVGGQWYG